MTRRFDHHIARWPQYKSSLRHGLSDCAKGKFSDASDPARETPQHVRLDPDDATRKLKSPSRASSLSEYTLLKGRGGGSNDA